MANDVTTFSPLVRDLYGSLADYFFWVSFCMFFQGISFTFSRHVLARVYGILFGRSRVLMGLPILLSAAFYCTLLCKPSVNVDKLEMYVLSASVVLSSFAGFLLSEQELSCSPPVSFILPLCIGLQIYRTNVEQVLNIPMLMAGAIGPAFGLLLFYGYLTGFSGGYFAWITILCLINALELQVQLVRVLSEQMTGVEDEWRFIVLLTAVDMACYVEMSTSPLGKIDNH